MKNFTKQNFKQFTSRLSARWLIMALMMLVGTSSAWGAKTTLKQGETITFIFSQGDVPQNYGWNSTQLHIWDDSGNDKTFDFNGQHVLVAGDWIPTKFQFISKYEHSGWRGQTSDIGDCGAKTKLQPNTTYSVKLAGKDKTDWIGNKGNTNSPNKQFKITLHCFADCTPTVSDKITIKCSSDEKLVYAWVWGASTNANYNTKGWPGDQITDTDSDGVLDLTISTTENLNIIFSNGSSQTGNILGLQVGKEYTYWYKGTDYTLENIVCIKPSCTDPKAADFSYADPKPTYDGTAKSATVKWKDDNTSTGITVKYGGSTTAPTDAGTYAITVSTTAHGNICASKSDISLGDFTINKADQKALSISTDADVCGKSVTLATSGGTGTGSVTYSISGTNNIGASISGTTLSATSSGSVKVKATKSGGTNYNDATVEKTFTFTMPIENVTLTKVNDSKTTYCVGDRAEFKLTYSGPYPTSYAWSGTAMGSLEATGKTAKVLDNGASWYIDFSEAKTYTIALSLTGCNTDASDELSFTVYALPSAPTFTTNSAQVCSGVAFNLNEKFPRKSGEAGTLTWYKTSDDSQVTDPASVTITEATSYYAKATNNNCTSGKSFDCTVNVDAKPILELASTPTVCPNVEIDLDNYVTSNTGTLTWYSNQERTTVITDGLVTPTERTTYYAKVINGTCNPVENEFTVDVYGIPDEMPAYTSTPATSCKGTPNSDGSIALKNTIGYITYTLDGKEGDSNVWTGLSVGTHKLAATINTCPSITKEWDVVVEVEDITPDATVSITGDDSFCEGGNTILTSVVTATQGEVTAYQWYNGEELIQGATASTYTANVAGNYKVVVTVNNNDCVDTFEATKEVSVKNKPTTPAFNPNFTSICVGGSTTLASGYSWYTDLNASALANLTVSPQTETTYYAIKEEDGCTSDAGTFTVTVNPLPRITSISASNDKPVLFEDVVLTANNVTNGAQVNWYVGEDLVAENTNTYTVTSETAGEVTVKAKAFLNGCESDFKEHKVTFGNEVCQKTESKNIEITFKHPNKNNNNAACQYWGFGYIFMNGVTPNNNNSNYLAVFPNKEETSGSKTVTLSNIQSSTIKIYLKAFYQYGGCTASTKIITLTRGKKYEITISSDEQGNGMWEKEATVTEKGSLPQDLKITAPAVKITSAAYNENTGKIDASGAVYKTGCGETFWGFQYSVNGQTWGSADADFIRPSTGNSLTEPGKFEYSFEIPDANGGDIYYIRAYAINNYNKDNYSLNSAVFSETKIPVEFPSSTIESATISLVDSEGNESTDTKVCPQSTVYLKVSYVGGDFKSFEAADNFPGTNLEKVSHDKANNYAIFSYTATSTGVANITISNENTSVTPETGVSITVKEVSVATPPTIYLEKNTICDNQTTNVVVNSPIVGLSYSLKNGSVGDPVTYESGDLKFSVSKEGSYTVQVQETVCGTTAISAPVDLRVITSDVKITLTTDVDEITPWQPLTLTVKAPSGYDYDLQGLDGTVYTKSGDVYTIKFPRPDSWGVGNSESKSEPKTFTAGIKAGEEPSCSTTTKEIQLVDTEEVCLAPGN